MVKAIRFIIINGILVLFILGCSLSDLTPNNPPDDVTKDPTDGSNEEQPEPFDPLVPPLGFTLFSEAEDAGIYYLYYTGESTLLEAQTLFHDWLILGGAALSNDTPPIDIASFTLYESTAYSEYLMLYVFGDDGVITVSIMILDRDYAPPIADIPDDDSFGEDPVIYDYTIRYLNSVRIDFFTAFEHNIYFNKEYYRVYNRYLTSDSPDDVFDYFHAQLTNRGWSVTLESDGAGLNAISNNYQLYISVSPSYTYDDYNEIVINAWYPDFWMP